MKRNYLHIYLIFGLFAWASLVQLANATIIYPGDPNWKADLNPPEKQVEGAQGYGYASISKSNPRSGNASLALGTTSSLSDWAFYNRYADKDQTGNYLSWGLLSDVDGLSFDWYRETVVDIIVDDLPWQMQTPVLRLYVADPLNTTHMLSELVWEKYYTNNTNPARTNEWVSQSIFGDQNQNQNPDQNLWRHVFGAGPGSGYTVVGGETKEYFFPDPLLTLPISSPTPMGSWLSYYSPEAVVYGIGVGVGNYWPHEYVGYVDNVMLDFEVEQLDGTTRIIKVLNDNFEIPEPSSLVLVTCGLALLVTAGFIRRRRENQGA